MQIVLSAGFPMRLLERHSEKAFKNVFKKRKKSNLSEYCQSLQDLKEWLKPKKWECNDHILQGMELAGRFP